MAYTQTLHVRFDDVDFAQVVYFPKLLAYCHWVFEDFFRHEVGVPYSELLGARRTGFPTVSTRADFKAPFRFGDPCRIVMTPVKVGESSITCRYHLYNGDTLGAEIDIVTVCIVMDTFKPRPIPDDVRAKFREHL